MNNERLDISVVIDTSGSQVGDKQSAVKDFFKDLLKEFDTQTAVKISITDIGDGREGQVNVSVILYDRCDLFYFCRQYSDQLSLLILLTSILH